MAKQKPPRKPGRPRLGGVVVKARLPREAHAALAERARASYRSTSDLIRDAVVAYLSAAAA